MVTGHLPNLEMIRKSIETSYYDICTVYVRKAVQNKEDFSTEFKEVILLEDFPCKLTFQEMNTTFPTEQFADRVVEIVRVFLAPEPIIPPGSIFVIHHANKEWKFKSSGEPSLYDTHQQIMLKVFDDKS